jgi:hypothetical protein
MLDFAGQAKTDGNGILSISKEMERILVED